MRTDLQEAAEGWDRNAQAAKLEAANEQRERIVEAFPADAWPDLPLERYALGLDRNDTYSYLLEFGSQDIGSIRGGSAKKLLIYKQKTKPGWYFNSRYANERDAWEAIRAGYVEMLGLAAEGRFDEIDEIEALLGGPAARGKTTWVYFPDELLPIYSEAHLDHFLELFELDPGAAKAVGKNRRLFEALSSSADFAGWSPLEIMFFLYDWANPAAGRQIVKISPGEQARLWGECRDGGFICLGWDDVGDLTEFPDKASFRERFGEAYPSTTGHETRKSNELWTLMELEPGDLIVANRGTSAVVGIGTVNDAGYAYRPEREEYRHTLGVDWIDDEERHIDPVKSWATVTVARVKQDLYKMIAGDDDAETDPAEVPAPDPVHKLAHDLLEHRGQLIFYGPPGTGKTWTALRHCVWTLIEQPDADLALADDEVFRQCEEELTAPPEPRPSWVAVANPQTWSWEQMFVDGEVDYSVGRIASNYQEARVGDLVVGYQATPDKRIVALARVQSSVGPADDGEDRIWFEPVCRVEDGLTWAELQSDETLAASEPMTLRMQGTLFRLEPHETTHLLTRLAERDPALQRVLAARDEPTPSLTRVTFHPTYTYEDFVEGYKPVEGGSGLDLRLRDGIFKRICRTAANDPDQSYVLLVDEINRGNVPKIFGELITLLEKDKRGVTVTLPQSGEEFSVPDNVYLIGTMNTADRSIHMLDAALRRRFAFLERLPDLTVLAGGQVGSLKLDDFLEELNRRIRERVGREKQIGHALFLDGQGEPISSTEVFALVFRFELLPLVQEYTFGDYSDLQHFFGSEIIDAQEERPNDELLTDPASLVEALADHLRTG